MENFIKHAVDEAANSKADSSVVVVLGANADLLKEIDEEIVHVVENKNWEEGMASSVRLGLKTLCRILLPSVDAVILMVCDQPYVSSLLNDLITTHKKLVNRSLPAIMAKRSVPRLFFINHFFQN